MTHAMVIDQPLTSVVSLRIAAGRSDNKLLCRVFDGDKAALLNRRIFNTIIDSTVLSVK